MIDEQIMKTFAFFLGLCLLANVESEYLHHQKHLEAVPDSNHFGMEYPKYDVLELGEFVKESLPPAVVNIRQKIRYEVPKPYPVKVPHPYPQPIHIPKPYPVVQLKVVKVPHPVPYEVIKHVPVHIEVPKPYPVSKEELHHNIQPQQGGYNNLHQVSEELTPPAHQEGEGPHINSVPEQNNNYISLEHLQPPREGYESFPQSEYGLPPHNEYQQGQQ